MDELGDAGEAERQRRRSPASRVLGAGARGAERVAAATGIDAAMEDAVEEAIVRALRSPAVERALVRVIERNAVQGAIQRALSSDEVAAAIAEALDSELADRVWADLLASEKAQQLVERIAEAPEIRAAIAEQGVGLITDLGRRLTTLTEALDDAAERLAHRIVHGSAAERETNQVGLFTRVLANSLDLALIWLASIALLAMIDAALFGGDGVPVAVTAAVGLTLGAAFLVVFWSLVGQTPGMRLLSIRLDVGGSAEIGLRRALVRVLALPVSLLPAGLGFLWILVSPTRRGWHDLISGTVVVYERDGESARRARHRRGSHRATAGSPSGS